jgi:hypothetical protein
MNKDGGQRWEPPNYFWVKIAVQGKPLDAAAAPESLAKPAALPPPASLRRFFMRFRIVPPVCGRSWLHSHH